MDFTTVEHEEQATATKRPRGARPSVLLVLCLLITFVVPLGALAHGLGALGAAEDPDWIARGGWGLFVWLLVLPIAVGVDRQRRAAHELGGHLTDLGAAVRSFAQQAALSDDARRVYNRRAERDLLRSAIEEDIAAEDWDAAAVLCAELADRFGYRADAEELRRQIDRARFQNMERRVAIAINELDQMLGNRNWSEAMLAASRIVRMYPDSPSVEGLRHRVESARARYRAELERRFLEAAQDDRIDEAMALLEELDGYLTETEAAPYQEVARGVIGKAKKNLGASFKLAVHDHRWVEAADLGALIIERFPNSRMASEVRGMLEVIREKAQVAAES
jgi:hypothetical protein